MRGRVASGLVGVLLAWTLLVTGPLVAQSSGGTISGVVSDGGGGPIPGASVMARNVGTNASRTVVSTGTGAFTFAALPVGGYEVTAALAGFETAKQSVTLVIGGDVTLKLALKVSGVAAAVTVSMEAPLVETSRSQVSSVVNEKMVASLPTNGRNFIDFVLTTPGVTKDTRLGDISFAGQRGTLNSLVVDGADNNNTFFGQALGRTGSGRAPYQFSQDAVQEFQVNANAYSAEYGRAGGAVINVVTKSGTNEFHGTAFEFFRDKGLNQNDYINELNNRVKGPYHFNQFGASLGGPILKERLFFFANYDGQRNTQPNTVVLSSNVPTDADTAAGVAKLQRLAESYGRNQDQDVFLLKTDLELGASRLSLRYNRQEFNGKNFENGGTTNAQEHTGDSNVNTDTVTASFTSQLASTFVNELRGQYAKDSEPGLSNSDQPEATIQNGGSTYLVIGRNFFSPRETTITRYQVADTVTLLFDKHTVKAGFDLNWDKILNFFPGNFSGSYTFPSIAAYNRNQPSRYVQAFAGPGTSGPNTNPDLSELALFLQDEFRIANGLTLNAGVRYDKTGIKQPSVRNPDAQLLAAGYDTSSIAEDTNNIAARLGIAWSPTDSTVVRAGYGMFYGRTPAIMIGTAHSNNGINVQTLTFTGAQIPVYPAILPSIPTGVALPKPTIFAFDPDFESPLIHQASLGIEQRVTNDLAVSLSYQYVKGTHLQRSTDVNIGAATLTNISDDQGNVFAVKQFTGVKPFASFGRVIAFQSSAESEYNGLTIDINKRYSNHWQGRIAYTFGKVTDTKPDATAVVPASGDDGKFASDPSNFDVDSAPGDNDQRHRIVLSGLWNLDYFDNAGGLTKALLGGWSISGIFSIASGQPYSATMPTNVDLNLDGNTRNDLAPGFTRNSLNLPTQMSFDPRITKEFGFGAVRLQLIAEAFNLFNRSNVSGVRNVYYSFTGGRLVRTTNFQEELVSTGPRIIQLAAKVIF